MSVALGCLRDEVKSVYEYNASLSDIAGNCCIRVLSSWIINNKFMPQSGSYHELIKKQFRTNTKVVIAKLRKYGITDETILELSQTLFGSTEDAVLEKILKKVLMNKILVYKGEFIFAVMLIVLMTCTDYDSFINGLQKDHSFGLSGGMKQLLLIIDSSIGKEGVYSVLITMVIWLLYSSYKDRKNHRNK